MTNIKGFYIWVLLFPGRLWLIFLGSFLFSYNLNYVSIFFKLSTVLVLLLISINFLRNIFNSNNIYSLIDKVVITVGLILIFFKILQLDFQGIKIAFILFILPQLLREFNWKDNLVCRTCLIVLGVIVSIEYFLEILAMNSHMVGLEHLWYVSDKEFLEYGQRFNPLKQSFVSHRYQNFFFRGDGFFGHYFSTASYLAIIGSFLLVFACYTKKLFLIFISIIILFPVLLSLSAFINLALFLGLFLYLILEQLIDWKKKVIFLGLFVFLLNEMYLYNFSFICCNPLQWVVNKTLTNLKNPYYIDLFVPFLKNDSIIDILIELSSSFELWSHVVGESDIVNIIYTFGLFPTLVLVIYYGNIILSILWSKSTTQDLVLAKSLTASLLVGSLLLIHDQAVLGWAVGSIYFLFLSTILNYYSNKTNLNEIV